MAAKSEKSTEPKKNNELRKNTFHRKLTQINLDRGEPRDYSIKHAEISIEINKEKFEAGDKSVVQILKESLSDALHNLAEKEDKLKIDVYNQENSMSVRYKYRG